MASLPFRLDRSVFIGAKPDTVFAFFQDTARWAAWWGAGSTIDPRIGGRVYVKYPNAVEASGEVLEIDPPRRLVFTYGYQAPDSPVPAGSSRVTITLGREASGTRLTLTHELPTEAARNEHVQGWRFQLSIFANVVANTLHAHANDRVDAWFAAWAETDAARRRAAFAAICAPDVRFGDQYSLLTGVDDVTEHAGAAQKFMPGMSMRRAHDARQTLGTALVDWEVAGNAAVHGTNMFQFDEDGRIASVLGFWK